MGQDKIIPRGTVGFTYEALAQIMATIAQFDDRLAAKLNGGKFLIVGVEDNFSQDIMYFKILRPGSEQLAEGQLAPGRGFMTTDDIPIGLYSEQVKEHRDKQYRQMLLAKQLIEICNGKRDCTQCPLVMDCRKLHETAVAKLGPSCIGGDPGEFKIPDPIGGPQ